MEAAIINLLAPGDHAIFVNGGKFGERWGKLLATFGVVGHEVKVEWGRAGAPEQIEEALRAYLSACGAYAGQRDLDLRGSSGAIGQVTRARGAC